MTILQFAIILFPGLIAAGFHTYVSVANFKWNIFLKNAVAYIFLINSTNVFFARLFGWELNYFDKDSSVLVKYMVCSLLISVVYPGAFCFFKAWIQKRKFNLNAHFSKIGIILLASWVISTLLSITVLKRFFLLNIITSSFILKFLMVFCVIGALLFSTWYLFRHNLFELSDNRVGKIINIGIPFVFLIVIGGVMLYAILTNMVEMPRIVSSNMLYEFICIMLVNITLCLFAISLIDILKRKYQKIYSIAQFIYFLLFPVLSFTMIEALIKTEVYSQFIYFLGNLLIYYCVFFLLHAMIRSRKLVLIAFGTICFIFGIADYFVYDFRGTPILPADIWSLDTAVSVANGYKYGLSMDLIIEITVFLVQVTVICVLFEKRKRIFNFKKYLINCGTSIVIAGLCILLLENSAFNFEVNKWDKIGSYQSNGTALCIYNDIKASWVQKPEGYSANKIKEISDEVNIAQENTNSESVKPNIIVIMNEAFSDLNSVKELATSEDTMPFIHSLSEDTIKGSVLVSVYGGNTCNSEFEFLTGNSMAFLPQGSIPYQQYVSRKMDSISTILQSQDYVSSAIHPYYKNGWRRSQVYPLLGLDTFYSIADFIRPKLLRGYISDSDSFNKIKKVVNNNYRNPNFVFNVTMQNHGGYSGDVELENWVSLTDSSVSYPRLEEYLTLVRTTDAALENMINYYKSLDAPTIILMFGDHQPSMVGETYDYLYGNIEDAPLADQQKKYMTSFLIWANYDIEEKEDVMLSPNYLSSYLMDIAGAKITKYNKYLLDLQKKVPAINAYGYLGDDGNWYDFDEETAYSDDILEYQNIQYNNLFDNENRVDEFYKLSY